MTNVNNETRFDMINKKSMREFGQTFIDALPKHIRSLQIPGRKNSADSISSPLPAQIDEIDGIQRTMQEVLYHPTTQEAETYAENTFTAFLEEKDVNAGVLKFFNGWDETHKTTSLVSAKIIMRLSGDAIFIPSEQQEGYYKTMAHMHEVAKDDFGLGHKGHDGMYTHITMAFGAIDWVENQYKLPECNEFSKFLYEAGVAGHKLPLNSRGHNESILEAMMISVASEIWNGREYNFIAQYIEEKLLSSNPALANDATNFRNAKGYVMGHAGEVENKHGLHALAAAQVFARTKGLSFRKERLKEVMLDYTDRVGKAFNAMHRSLMANS